MNKRRLYAVALLLILSRPERVLPSAPAWTPRPLRESAYTGPGYPQATPTNTPTAPTPTPTPSPVSVCWPGPLCETGERADSHCTRSWTCWRMDCQQATALVTVDVTNGGTLTVTRFAVLAGCPVLAADVVTVTAGLVSGLGVKVQNLIGGEQ